MNKTSPPGMAITFKVPLIFGDWPLEKIEQIIKDTEEKNDLSDFEIEFVERGGYLKCQGYGDHKACDELRESYGQIVWKRKGL
jgi:hypothetical protein